MRNRYFCNMNWLSHIRVAIGVLTMLCLTMSLALGQGAISVTISQDTITIGDHLRLEYTIKVPSATEITLFDFSAIDSSRNLIYQEGSQGLDEYLDYEIISAEGWSVNAESKQVSPSSLQKIKVNGQDIYKGAVVIAPFSVGVFYLEYPVVASQPDVSFLPVEKVRLFVQPPLSILQGDSLQLNPIKPIIKEGVKAEDFYPYLIGVVILGLLILASFFLWKKRIQPQEAYKPEEVAPILPAHEIALLDLEALRKQRLWQAGDIKGYQSRLTEILRKYLSDRYDIDALEMTTEEITSALRKTDFNLKKAVELSEMLNVADLVKFAKAKPEESIHDLYMEKAIAFVESTKLINPQTETF